VTYTDLMNQWRDTCADLQAAEQALPPAAEVESRLRETLGAAAEGWHRFTARIAAELATGTGHVTLRQLHGGVDLGADLPLAGALAAHGVDRLLKQARDEAAKVLPQPVRLTADEKAEAIAALSRQRYELEAQIASLHFEEGAALPENIAAAALLGLPLEVAEDAGLLRWES